MPGRTCIQKHSRAVRCLFKIRRAVLYCHRVLNASSPVDLHIQLLLHSHLVLIAQVVKPWVRFAQVAFDEVELRRETTHLLTSVGSEQKKKATGVRRSCTHLLGLGRVSLGVHFEERKLVTIVVVHPFAEMVANVKSPAR